MGAKNGTHASSKARAPLPRQVRDGDDRDFSAGLGGVRADGAGRAANCGEVINGAVTGCKTAESAGACGTTIGHAINDSTVDGRHEQVSRTAA